MKKRITRDQLSEITEEQQKILAIKWSPEVGDYIVDLLNNDPKEYFVTNAENISKPHLKNVPLLTIGQMIEILQDSGMQIFLDGTHWYDNDICDKLWDEVKRVVAEKSRRQGPAQVRHNRQDHTYQRMGICMDRRYTDDDAISCG